MQTYPTGYAESHRIAEQIFREILPRHGMAVREEQIALCHEILDTLYNKEISLCEAGVGIGKTLAYLVACVLWQMNRPDRLKLPVVISTSSVVLQDAIINDYLPNLSAILLEEGIIQVPLTAVIRKGKERFVCDARLAERASLVHPKRTREKGSLRIDKTTPRGSMCGAPTATHKWPLIGCMTLSMKLPGMAFSCAAPLSTIAAATH